MPTWIWTYECQTSAGSAAEDLWESLDQGLDHSQVVSGPDFNLTGTLGTRVHRISDSLEGSSKARLSQRLQQVFKKAFGKLSDVEKEQTKKQKLGVILASTKGSIEDFIWDGQGEEDPLFPVLDHFLKNTQLQVEASICVSNACASSLVAMSLAQSWIQQERVEAVWVLACDEIGPFVIKGFQSLKALAKEQARPFSADRDGLMLGEGASAILVSKKEPLQTPRYKILNVGTDTEGFAATRPSTTGISILQAYRQINCEQDPDLIIAHGTGTYINDQSEDFVLATLFKEKKIPITATKWCVGHTLGASAAIDICAALETLSRQKAFRIATTKIIDSQFKGLYLCASSDVAALQSIKSILITSLGFGGVHAAAIIIRDS